MTSKASILSTTFTVPAFTLQISNLQRSKTENYTGKRFQEFTDFPTDA